MFAIFMRPQGIPGLKNLFTNITNKTRVCDVHSFHVLRNVIFQSGEFSTIVATPHWLALRVVLHLCHVLCNQPVQISQPFWTEISKTG